MDRVKCAYVKLSKDEQKTDVTEVEEVLNCKVLHGFGVESKLANTLDSSVDILVPAYFGVFIRDAKSAGGVNIDEFPDFLMFSDSVDETMFDLRYGPAGTKFSITPTSLHQVERLMWAIIDAEKLLAAAEELKKDLDALKAGALQLNDFMIDLNVWSESIELHLQDVRRVVELRASSMLEMFKTGWQ